MLHGRIAVEVLLVVVFPMRNGLVRVSTSTRKEGKELHAGGFQGYTTVKFLFPHQM